MELLSIIMAAAALLLSVFTYFKHERKLKLQEEQINSYELEKIEAEKIEGKKAIIEANVVRGLKGQRTIKVYNRGKSIAKEVNVSFSELQGAHITNSPFPMELRPQHSGEIFLVLLGGRNHSATIEFEWKDEFSDENIDSQVLQLY